MEEHVLIDARDVAHALWEEVRSAMVEIDRPASLALCCLLAAGHLLVEDVPGVGKTTLAKVIARAIGGHDSRIQCTEDLTASGVIGQEIESDNPALRPDEFIPGPDLRERRRASTSSTARRPRMQSGLLEAMEEHAVTVGKRRHPLPRPFFCIGTMNPHDNAGTFELAHASLRPLRDAHRHRLPVRERRARPPHPLRQRRPARGERSDRRARRRRAAAEGHRQLPAAEAVRAYLVRLLRSTREHPDVLVGASPRALLSMFRCAQAAALLDNAAEVAVKHVRSLFEPCIAHRIRVRPDASARAVCEEILERTPVPVTDTAAHDRRDRPAGGRPHRRRERTLAESERGRSVQPGFGSLLSRRAGAQVLEHDRVEPLLVPPAGLEVLDPDEVAQRGVQAVRRPARSDSRRASSRPRTSSASASSSGSLVSSGVVPSSSTWMP